MLFCVYFTLPSGNWTVNVYLGKDATGKEIRKRFTGPDKRLVMQEATTFAAEHRDVTDQTTLRGACEALVSDSKLSPSTIRGYQTPYNYLKEHEAQLLDSKLYAITQKDLQGMVSRHSSTHSPKTTRNLYGFVSSAAHRAGVRLPIVDVPQREKPEYQIPSDFEVKAMLSLADGQLWICIALAVFGPLRAGEIAALRYTYDEDVDFEKNTIHVSHDYIRGNDGKYHLKEPKTPTSDRVLVMPDFVMARIREQGYVTTWDGGLIYKHFERFLKKYNLQPCRFHDLRHYGASYLHAKGYPDAYIQARTGHATAGVLRNVYTHTISDEEEEMTAHMMEDYKELAPTVHDSVHGNKKAL